jgi:transcriptional regulator with XRE-family HTH domain
MRPLKGILRRVRLLSGLTQTDLGAALGITPSAVSKKERVCDENLTIHSLADTFEVLGVKARLVVEFEDGHKETFRVTEK